MDDNRVAIGGFLLLLILFLYFIIVHLSPEIKSDPSQAPEEATQSSATPVEPTPQASPAECGQVDGSCTAIIKIQNTSCSADILKRYAASSLRDPLAVDDCLDINKELNKSCPNGCRINFDEYLVVPGKIEYTKMSGPDESGQCSIKGRRSVNVRASCMPIQ